MFKVVEIDPKAGRKQEVVDMARNILAMAESGDIVDLTFAASRKDGGVHTGFTATDDAHQRLSAVSRILHRLHLTMDDASVDGY